MTYDIVCRSCKHTNVVDEGDLSGRTRCRMCNATLRVPRKIRRYTKANARRQRSAERRKQNARRPVAAPPAHKAVTSSKARSEFSVVGKLFGLLSHATTVYAIVSFLVGGAVVYEATNPTIRPMFRSNGSSSYYHGGGAGGSGADAPFGGAPSASPHDRALQQLEQINRINEINRQNRERTMNRFRTPNQINSRPGHPSHNPYGPAGRPRSPYAPPSPYSPSPSPSRGYTPGAPTYGR